MPFLVKEVENGWLPLHYACRFKAPKEVVRLLLHLYPDKGRLAVSKRDRQGRTPLYYAVRYEAPPGVVGLLLEVDPSAVLEEDQNEDSPLALVWDSWAEKLEGKRTLQPYLPMTTALGVDVSPSFLDERAVMLRKKLMKDSKLNKRWSRVNTLLKAAFGFPVEDDEITDGGISGHEEPGLERKWRIVHAAAAIKCHLSLFLLACALHPEQVRELDESDLRRPGDVFLRGERSHQTALHFAASSSADGETAKVILEILLGLFPEATAISDGIDGSLPLHRLVENERKQDWTRFGSLLYQANPRSVQIADRRGKLPLHRAIAAMKHAQNSCVKPLLETFPQAAARADADGCLPLHIAAMNAECWDETINLVYLSYPKAISTRAGPAFNHRLALHMAAASTDSRESLLQSLAELHPRAAAITDTTGKLPLHLACELGKDWEGGIGVIHNAYPAAISTAEDNIRGWLPLHIVADAMHTRVDLIEAVLQRHVAAASVADSHGQYPLHLACKSGKKWKNGLEVLFVANPGAIGAADDQGQVPLLISSFKYCRKNGLEKVDQSQEACELDVLFNLLRSDPTVLQS
jgi:ankyrin repeat protein